MNKLLKVSLQLFIAAIALCAVFISCASTPRSRIKEKEKVFFGYPPEIQGQIQAGQIDRGFSEDMVYLAKGSPSEKYSHEVAGKSVTIWKYYQKPDAVSPPGSQPTGFSGAYEYPTPGKPQQPYPMFYNKPGLIVEFENGKVKKWTDPR